MLRYAIHLLDEIREGSSIKSLTMQLAFEMQKKLEGGHIISKTLLQVSSPRLTILNSHLISS